MTAEEQKTLERASLVLLRAAAEQKGPQKVLDAAYELLGLPIELNDMAFQLIASAGAPEELRERLHQEEDKDLSDMRGWMQRVNDSREPVIDETGVPYRVMGLDVHIRGAAVAKLAVFETSRPFRETDAGIAKLLASALACVLGREEERLPDRSLANLVRDLISGIVPPSEVERLQPLLGIAPEKTRYIMVMEEPEKNTAVYPLLMNRCFHRLSGTAAVLGDTLVCLLEEEQRREELEAFLGENRIRGGLSRSFLRLSQLRDHYLQAAFALKQARREEKILVEYGDCLARDAAEHCLRDRGPESFCRPEVLRLWEYDRIHGTDYMETLQSYCQSLCSVTETARAGFLHYNTVKYRLKAIRDITGMEELRGQDIFEFWLSFRLIEMKEPAAGPFSLDIPGKG